MRDVFFVIPQHYIFLNECKKIQNRNMAVQFCLSSIRRKTMKMKNKKEAISLLALTLVSMMLVITSASRPHAKENNAEAQEAIVKIVNNEYTFIAVIAAVILVSAFAAGVKHLSFKMKDIHIDSGENDTNHHKRNKKNVEKVLSTVTVILISVISSEFLLKIMAMILV